jgi:hypothetical protein
VDDDNENDADDTREEEMDAAAMAFARKERQF